MRRADRLFQIIQILRRAPRPVTAAEIARELEVSARTVYRDVADLVGQRVPILGEGRARLRAGRDIRHAAADADTLRDRGGGSRRAMGCGPGRAGPRQGGARSHRQDHRRRARAPASVHRRSLDRYGRRLSRRPRTGDRCRADRAWIREGRKIRIDYRDARGDPSRRVIWPVIVGFFDQARMLAGWCELRGEFRHFRTDRITDPDFLEERTASGPPSCAPGGSGACRAGRWVRTRRRRS